MATLSSSTQAPLRLHTHDLTVDASHPTVPPSPYSVTSLQVHEDTASLAPSSTTTTTLSASTASHHPTDHSLNLDTSGSTSKNHHVAHDDGDVDLMDPLAPMAAADSPTTMDPSKGVGKMKTTKKKTKKTGPENKRHRQQQRTGIPLTLSALRNYDTSHRHPAKETVVLAWMDHMAQAPMTETSHIIDLDRPSHYKMADAATAATGANATMTTATTTDAANQDTGDGTTIHPTNEAPIQETKDVFTETQKMAYVGLCAVTSLEVVHDLKGKEFTYARMSADNWQRKLMRMIYMHMDVSSEEIKMIESLSKHDILPTDFVYQFTAQGETATVNIKDLQGQPTTATASPTNQPSITTSDTAMPSSPPKQATMLSDHQSSSSSKQATALSDHQSSSSSKRAPALSDHQSSSSSKQTSTTSESDNIAPTSPPKQSSPAPSLPGNLSDKIASQQEDFNSHEEEDCSSMGIDNDNRDDATISSNDLPDLSTLPPLPPSSVMSSSSAADTASTCSNLDADSSSSSTSATHMDKYEAPEHFVIDLRWTVMCDLFLICLSLENYDARSRVFIHRMADYLSLDWHQVLSFERRITEHLLEVEGAWETQSSVTTSTTLSTASSRVDPSQLSSTKERTSRNKQRKKRRYVMIGLATIGGGLILGLSAGFMAPVIAGGLGALLTTVGVSGSSAFLGGATGIGLITSAATMAGGRLGAKSMNRRMKSIGTFDFLPIHVNHQASCIISVTGWLPRSDNKEEAATLPFGPLDSVMGDHYTLFWEPDMLEELGSAFKIFATEAVTFSVQQALGHTIMGALLAGLAWPLALTKLGYLVDNPWANGLDRAKSAGLILADVLMNRNLGARPVTLVGYSLGARVIFYCLEELARVNAYGLVEDVALFGTPVSASKAQWRDVTSIVAGRVVNGYATNDWLLGFLFRATNAGSTLVGNNVAGLHALETIEGNRVQNMDCTDLIKGHLSYRMAMPKLLKRAGFIVTKEDIVEKKEKEAPASSGGSLLGFSRKKSSTQDQSDADPKSSLSSGTASIQLPSKSFAPTTLTAPQQTTPSSSTSLQSTSRPTSPAATPQDSMDEVQPRSSTPLVEGVSDMDIIADIIANATAAAASKSGTYSSMSSGKASIASTPPAPASSSTTTPPTKARGSGFFNFTRSRSETTSSLPQPLPQQDTTPIRSSISSTTTSSFWSRNSKKNSIPPRTEDKDDDEDDVAIEIKEIKTTLGKMVVPGDVVHPMPKINLEMPQHARINR